MAHPSVAALCIASRGLNQEVHAVVSMSICTVDGTCLHSHEVL